ncbi:MAG: hypothetical protein LBU43_08040, partial [Candidatus Accumulibacter sp.]|nr:hypothetical protein [Accumulibacter sp.]
MIIPLFWAESRLQHREHGLQKQRQITLRRFGWSDESQDAAQAHADERVKEAMARVLCGEDLLRREPKVAYNGAEGVPIREEIVDRQGEAIITRNGYGARCLNTPNALFVDVDYPTSLPGIFTSVMFLAAFSACLYAFLVLLGECVNIAQSMAWEFAAVLPAMIAATAVFGLFIWAHVKLGKRYSKSMNRFLSITRTVLFLIMLSVVVGVCIVILLAGTDMLADLFHLQPNCNLQSDCQKEKLDGLRGLGILMGSVFLAGVMTVMIGALIFRLWKGLRNETKSALAKIRRFAQLHSDWNFRIYRTPMGLRVLVTHRPFNPSEPEVEQCFKAFDSDRMYQLMCLKQQCFRARVSAKPWRIGISDHMKPRPGTWPVAP